MNSEERSRDRRIGSLKFDYSREPKEFVPSCNLCGAEFWTVITHRDRYGFPAQATACNTCGLTVLNPRMIREGYGKFYRDTYRPLVSAFHGRKIDARSIQEEQRRYAVEVESWTAAFIEGYDNPTLLDVGGSTGVMAAHFSDRFQARATVLDPSPEEGAEARSQGIEVIESLMEDWLPGGRKFHVVCMFQTIDHLLDVSAALAKIRSVMRTDGVFIVDIVDFRWAFLKNRSLEKAVKIDHPFSLTEETMEVYLARSGFSVARKAYSVDRHLVGYVCRPARRRKGALPDPSAVQGFFQELRRVDSL